MGCQHIEQVFQNHKTREGVLKTCNMVRYIIAKCDPRDRYLHSMTCSDCFEINCGSTFMCVQCGFCGCWNNNHFMIHSKKVGHIFGLNSSNGLLFCFKCGDYIGDNELVACAPLNKVWDGVSTKSSIPSVEKRNGLSGLVNMGSTCFMSSIIQTLIHNPYILKHSMDQLHSTTCDLQKSSSCISCAVDQIISDFYGTSNSETSETNQQGFVNLLSCSWRKNKNLAGYSQQDAHEFWQFLLNQLHNDHLRATNQKASLKNDCNCISHRSFQGFLKSSIVCPECQNDRKTTIDPMMDLSLDIKNKSTLHECLDNFHKKEQLTDFNYHCEKCNTKQNAIKQLTIAKLPPVLVLQLKRFEHSINGSSVKLNNYIEFPTYLDMSKYCQTDKVSETPAIVYELIGLISHQGSVNQGHYTSICKIPGGQWFKFNDSMVTAVTETDVLKEQAYLLFYTVRQIG